MSTSLAHFPKLPMDLMPYRHFFWLTVQQMKKFICRVTNWDKLKPGDCWMWEGVHDVKIQHPGIFGPSPLVPIRTIFYSMAHGWYVARWMYLDQMCTCVSTESDRKPFEICCYIKYALPTSTCNAPACVNPNHVKMPPPNIKLLEVISDFMLGFLKPRCLDNYVHGFKAQVPKDSAMQSIDDMELKALPERDADADDDGVDMEFPEEDDITSEAYAAKVRAQQLADIEMRTNVNKKRQRDSADGVNLEPDDKKTAQAKKRRLMRSEKKKNKPQVNVKYSLAHSHKQLISLLLVGMADINREQDEMDKEEAELLAKEKKREEGGYARKRPKKLKLTSKRKTDRRKLPNKRLAQIINPRTLRNPYICPFNRRVLTKKEAQQFCELKADVFIKALLAPSPSHDEFYSKTILSFVRLTRLFYRNKRAFNDDPSAPKAWKVATVQIISPYIGNDEILATLCNCRDSPDKFNFIRAYMPQNEWTFNPGIIHLMEASVSQSIPQLLSAAEAHQQFIKHSADLEKEENPPLAENPPVSDEILAKIFVDR